MAYTTLDEFNQTGIEGLFRYTSEVSPIFFPLLLLAFFVIIFIGTFNAQGRFTTSFAVAGITTAIIAFLFSLVGGVMPTIAVTVSVVIAILGVFLLFVGDNDS